MGRLAVTLCALALALIGCGGSNGSGASDQQRSARYAGADAALRAGDYDRAINAFQALGSFRDSPRRLAQVKAAAGAALLASARRKLAQGHPRAALALAETATARYGDTSAQARALLVRAQRAQVVHHQAQLAGKAPG